MTVSASDSYVVSVQCTEVVIATHPDQDHLEGLLHVAERYDVELILLPKIPHTTQLQSEWLTILRGALEKNQTQYRFGWAGQELRAGELVLTMLGPVLEAGERAPGKKTNNAAILTRVDFHGLSFLLTSDAEAVVERRLVETAKARNLLDVDVLKAGHHGSKTSTTAELLEAASPQAVVISVGAKNSYGHPHPIVLARLKDLAVWRTDEHGSIAFHWAQGGWRLKTAR